MAAGDAFRGDSKPTPYSEGVSDPHPSRSAASPGFNWQTTYADLPEGFSDPADAAPAPDPQTVVLNEPLARDLGLDAAALSGETGAAVFTGQSIPPGATPVAQAYAGHQFGGFTMLGDGRAMLLGEHVTPTGERVDITLKGSGPTAFARRGDGLATLGPMLREHVVSEAMHALGIPTTRGLAVATTGRQVRRTDLLPGAVLTRVAASHVRCGTFQYAARALGPDAVRALADHVIDRHFPDAASAEHPHRAMFEHIVRRQAELVAGWMSVGFVHGVLNTDNLAVSGETIDYGPCAFLDAYDPEAVFSSIDRNGRYRYDNQPGITQWNLARLAEALLPLLGEPGDAGDDAGVAWATAAVEGFADRYTAAWRGRLVQKLGLGGSSDADAALGDELLALMQSVAADFTQSFRGLAGDADPQARPAATVLRDAAGFGPWRDRWWARLANQPGGPDAAAMRLRAVNPAVIPRNRALQDALDAAEMRNELKPVRRLLTLLSHPFDDPADATDLTAPPPAGAPRFATYCGT